MRYAILETRKASRLAVDAADGGQDVRHLDPRAGGGGRGRRGSPALLTHLLDPRGARIRGAHRRDARRAHGRGADSEGSGTSRASRRSRSRSGVRSRAGARPARTDTSAATRSPTSPNRAGWFERLRRAPGCSRRTTGGSLRRGVTRQIRSTGRRPRGGHRRPTSRAGAGAAYDARRSASLGPALVAPSTPARKADTRPLHTVVRVAPQVVSAQEDAGRTGALGPDARAQETLVESYAEASAQLGTALNDLREERDRSRGQVEDLEAMVAAAQEILSGKPLAQTLAPVLSRLAAVGGAGHATFLVPEGPHRLRTAAVLGLAEDPLVSSPAAMRHTMEAAANDPKPRFHEAADNLDVGQALDRKDLPFTCALVVPVRTPRGVQGLFALYYSLDAARPGEATLAHMGSMARVLTGALELSAALETVRGAERALEMALAGTASARGLEDVVSCAARAARTPGPDARAPGTPSWFVEEFARLAPSLSTALQAGRSLLAFSKGEIQQDTIFLDDLLGEVGGDTAVIQIAPGAEAVWGDAALVRLALRTLVEQMSGSTTGTLEIRATPAPGKVLLSVGVSGVATGAAAHPPQGPGPGAGRGATHRRAARRQPERGVGRGRR